MIQLPEGAAFVVDRLTHAGYPAYVVGGCVRDMLLGVQPAAPGWAAIAVRPHAVGVDRMSGTVPTAKGDVHVDWALEGGTMRITVDGPDVPLTVAVNGSIYHAEHGKISV